MDLADRGHGPGDEVDARQDDAHPEDGAEQAFEALRAEVAGLRRGIELVYREVQQDRPQPAAASSGAPDYTLTLGRMEKALGLIAGRLEAVERQPALQLSGAQLRAEIDAGARSASRTLAVPLADAAEELSKATAKLDGLFGRVQERDEQRKWLWAVGVYGMCGGAALWVALSSVLPQPAGDWMASLPIAGGNRWAAGEQLLQRASPDDWDRMVRLYRACDAGPTALCEAAITVRTMPTLPSQVPPTSTGPRGRP